MLAVTMFVLLFGYAAARGYYLGEDISLRLTAKQFDPTTHRRIEVNVTGVYILFPTLQGANMVNFSTQVVTLRESTTVDHNFSMNFGTEMSHLVLPAQIQPSTLAEIHVVGEVFDVVGKKYVETTDLLVENVTISKHLQYVQDQGFLGKASQLPTTFDIFIFPASMKISKSDWVVQLVYMNSMSDQRFTVFDTLNVTSVNDHVNTSLPFDTVMGKWNKMSAPPRKYMLLVGVKNGMMPFNNYAINNNSLSIESSFIVIDSSFDLQFVPASVKEYQPLKINFNNDSLGGMDNWWIWAQEKSNNQQYTLSCMSQKASQFGPYFEWYTKPLGFKTYPQLPVGDFWIFVTVMGMSTHDTGSISNYPTYNTSMTLSVLPHNADFNYPVSFYRQGMGQTLGTDLKENTNVSVILRSSFSTVYVQFFKKLSNSSQSNSSFGNRTTGWTPDGHPRKFSLIPGENKTVIVTIPSDLNFSITNQVRLYGWTEDCDGNHFGQNFVNGSVVSPTHAPNNGGGNNSSKLGPGAIVGIVCAVVFVCGVAAWWLCMRKGGNSPDRYQKLDHN